MENLIFSPIPLEQLREVIAQSVKTELQNLSPPQTAEEDYLTREEVCKKLKVSKVTLREWDKKGILKPSRLGTRVRYLRSSITQALTGVKKWERRVTK